MTHPTGGTPASPTPAPYTGPTPADRRRKRFGLALAAIALIVTIWLLFINEGTRITHASDEGTGTPETSETAKPSDTAAPTTTIDDPAAEVPPVVPEDDIASCGVLWSWKSYDMCVDKVASWMPAEFDKSKDVSKLAYAQVDDWANRFPNVDARVITVYNDVAPIMTDDEVRAKAAAEAKLDPSVAARLHIVRIERDFPGWYTVNTGNLENQRMTPFTDDRPDQVRVTLVPLDKDGKIDMAMVGSGVFVTCMNKKWLQLPPPVESTPPGTTTCCSSSTTTTSTTTTTTTTTSTTTTSTTTTQTSPPKNPSGGPSTSIVMPPPSETDAETTTPPPSTSPMNPTVSTDAPTVAPPVTETSSPPPVPTDLPPATSTVTSTVVDPGSQD